MNQHPDIHCNWGEIHFFDKDSNYEKGIDWSVSVWDLDSVNSHVVTRSENTLPYI